MNIAFIANLSSQAYEILNECKCGPEPFFVLVSSVNFDSENDLKTFEETLVTLAGANLLSVTRGTEPVEPLSARDLHAYVLIRLNSGEQLDDPPIAHDEFSFETTDLGLTLLKPEDRPVKISE